MLAGHTFPSAESLFLFLLMTLLDPTAMINLSDLSGVSREQDLPLLPLCKCRECLYNFRIIFIQSTVLEITLVLIKTDLSGFIFTPLLKELRHECTGAQLKSYM
jgi:hypothetical protein